MSVHRQDLVDWSFFERRRAQLGPKLHRWLSNLREDGHECLALIEAAMRDQRAAALVSPADRLKADALELGATAVATLAEEIETTSRYCLEARQFPDQLVREVVELRKVFEETLRQFDSVSSNPVVEASARRSVAAPVRAKRFG